MIEIIEFTDPVCTWCWGSEPVLRKIETKYQEQVKVKFVMGGLVEDMRDFQDEFNGIGGELSEVNKQIASHWLEASKRHGMPVKTEGFSFFTEEDTSTYPTNIAYKAAQMQDEKLADRFLRRVREAVAAEAKQANRMEVLQELVKEVGLDEKQWLEQMENGTAKQEFEKDLATCRAFQIYAFPSYLVKNQNGDARLLRGFQSYEAFQKAIRELSDGSIQEQQDRYEGQLQEQILHLIQHYESITVTELAMILDCSKQEIEEVVKDLVEQKMAEVKDAGNGYFIRIQAK